MFSQVSIDVLGSKIVLLFISDLDLSDQEVLILGEMYQEARHESVSHMFEIPYEGVWLPLLNKATPWTEAKRDKLEMLQARMPWYSVCEPWVLEEAVLRYIKEVWRFKKKPIIVVLDQQGNVVNLNALHIMWIWGSLAYPFSFLAEEAIWQEQTWGLDLLADIFHPLLLTWVFHSYSTVEKKKKQKQIVTFTYLYTYTIVFRTILMLVSDVRREIHMLIWRRRHGVDSEIYKGNTCNG